LARLCQTAAVDGAVHVIEPVMVYGVSLSAQVERWLELKATTASEAAMGIEAGEAARWYVIAAADGFLGSAPSCWFKSSQLRRPRAIPVKPFLTRSKC
jgi:hypothetical protein